MALHAADLKEFLSVIRRSTVAVAAIGVQTRICMQSPSAVDVKLTRVRCSTSGFQFTCSRRIKLSNCNSTKKNRLYKVRAAMRSDPTTSFDRRRLCRREARRFALETRRHRARRASQSRRGAGGRESAPAREPNMLGSGSVQSVVRDESQRSSDVEYTGLLGRGRPSDGVFDAASRSRRV